MPILSGDKLTAAQKGKLKELGKAIADRKEKIRNARTTLRKARSKLATASTKETKTAVAKEISNSEAEIEKTNKALSPLQKEWEALLDHGENKTPTLLSKLRRVQKEVEVRIQGISDNIRTLPGWNQILDEQTLLSAKQEKQP